MKSTDDDDEIANDDNHDDVPDTRSHPSSIMGSLLHFIMLMLMLMLMLILMMTTATFVDSVSAYDLNVHDTTPDTTNRQLTTYMILFLLIILLITQS